MSDYVLKVEYRNVAGLAPYASNSRTHSDEQVQMVAESIAEFGFTNPILVDECGTIIAGHGRLMAAQKLGIESVPCIALGHLSEAQRRAYVIADNKLAEHAGWDEGALASELAALAAMEYDALLTGFSANEIDAILDAANEVGEEGLTDPDVVPDVQAAVISGGGDVWLLGEHRLMCGDSTAAKNVAHLIGGGLSDLVFTDPPYGMSYGGGRAAGESASLPGGRSIKAHGMIIGDDLQGDGLLQMIADSIGNANKNSKEGAAAYVCFTWRTYSEFYAALTSIDLEPKSCIVWDKKSIGLGNSNYRPQHEFIFYCKGEWMGDKSQSDVWSMGRDAATSYVHPTQKPVELIERALKNSSKRGDIVHDCFGGSGSTLIACEKLGRHARLMELDPKYVDVIIRRWQDYTGHEAMLEGDGRTFAEIAAEREEVAAA